MRHEAVQYNRAQCLKPEAKFKADEVRYCAADQVNTAALQELMELGGWKSYEMVLRYAQHHRITQESRNHMAIWRWANRIGRTMWSGHFTTSRTSGTRPRLHVYFYCERATPAL